MRKGQKKINQIITFGIVLVCAMVFAACDNIVNKPEIYTPIENGYGRINIIFVGEEIMPQMARTVFPLTVFDTYVYTFTKVGEETGEEKTPDSNGIFSLELGSYIVEVQAFIGDEGSYTLAATGISEQFSVGPGDNDPVKITLSAADSEEEGQFSYTIIYPENATAEITLQKWPSLDDVTLNPVDLSEGNGITEMLELEASSYLLTVIIRKPGLIAGINEAIHIYPLISTVYTKDFNDGDIFTPSFTVTFDVNGGVVTPESAFTGVGCRLTNMPTPERAGYFFTGWWTAATGGTQISVYTVFTENTTIYAQWIESYTVTFNANGESVTLENSATGAGYRLTTLPTPERSGYFFNGWWTAATGGTQITTSTVFTENTTIYAQWIESYTITFNANGGTVTPERAATDAGYRLTPLPTPERSGYIFTGWWTAATDGTQITTSTIFTEDTTIYAQWIEGYTITFNANGGSVTPTSVATGVDYRLAILPTPVRNGYFFTGWWTDQTDGTQVTTSTIYTENTTIHAQWIVSYTITFNANDGSVSPTSASTGVGYSLATLPTPSRTGHTFNGWYTAATGGTQVTTNTVFTQNTIIYARWTENVYTITFNANGGTVSPTSASTGAGRVLANLPIPTRSGYIFTGWWTATTGGSEIFEGWSVFSQDTTIYARWDIIVLTLAEQLRGIQDNAQSNTEYIINVNADESISPHTLSYGNRTNITITLRSSSARTVSLSSNGAMFTVGTGVTLVLENNITLRGRANNNNSLIVVNGTFRMSGGTISGNTSNNYSTGGVHVNSGTFTLSGGTISGNTGDLCGGVTVVNNSTFTMSSGTVSGNTGGGVVVGGSTFTMRGGNISGNTGIDVGGVMITIGYDSALGYNRAANFTMSDGTISENTVAGSLVFDGGGGVYVYENCTFTMSGGVISGNIVTGLGGGGVYVFRNGIFNKSGGGIIYGNDAASANRNTASSGGHAVYWSSSPNRFRNTTLNTNNNISTSNTSVGWGQ